MATLVCAFNVIVSLESYPSRVAMGWKIWKRGNPNRLSSYNLSLYSNAYCPWSYNPNINIQYFHITYWINLEPGATPPKATRALLGAWHSMEVISYNAPFTQIGTRPITAGTIISGVCINADRYDTTNEETCSLAHRLSRASSDQQSVRSWVRLHVAQAQADHILSRHFAKLGRYNHN